MLSRYRTIVPWVMQRRRSLDVLVHPNTGCEAEDHTSWAIWGGQPWRLSLDYFYHDQPFPWPDGSEYDQGFPEARPDAKTEL